MHSRIQQLGFAPDADTNSMGMRTAFVTIAVIQKGMKKMLDITRKINTLNMSREEWLSHRRRTLGGSDAGAIVGLSQWASPYTVWADKLGLLPEKEDSEAMKLGRDLEDYVARRWATEKGKRVKRVNAILYNDAYPFAAANVDRWVIGENAGLECKTTASLDLKKFKGVEFPEQYYAQCVHYMAVTGAERWYLAVLVYGRGFFTYCLERDQAEIDALMGAEGQFWIFVENKEAPPIDGSDATATALGTVYPESNTDRNESFFGRDALFQNLIGLKSKKKELDGEITAIENQIKADMGEAERGSCDGFHVTWKSQVRRTLDTKALTAAMPELDLEPYYKSTIVRPLKVTERKD